MKNKKNVGWMRAAVDQFRTKAKEQIEILNKAAR